MGRDRSGRRRWKVVGLFSDTDECVVADAEREGNVALVAALGGGDQTPLVGGAEAGLCDELPAGGGLVGGLRGGVSSFDRCIEEFADSIGQASQPSDQAFVRGRPLVALPRATTFRAVLEGEILPTRFFNPSNGRTFRGRFVADVTVEGEFCRQGGWRWCG